MTPEVITFKMLFHSPDHPFHTKYHSEWLGFLFVREHFIHKKI